MGIVVFVTYRPRAGEGNRSTLLELVRIHVPLLRELGMATDRPGMILERRGEGDEIVEVFEWVTEERSRAAHDDEQVADLWRRMAEVAEFIPLADLDESKRPFTHFDPLG